MKKENWEEKNPCFKEEELTYKCFERHNYDKSKCFFHIENYKACKRFWGEVQSARRRAGIRPLLPPGEDRQKIREEFLASQKKN